MAWSDPHVHGRHRRRQLATAPAIGVWSGDGGNTWAKFATYPTGVAENKGGEASIAVTARNKAVWAPGNSVPSYTTDNGATLGADQSAGAIKHRLPPCLPPGRRPQEPEQGLCLRFGRPLVGHAGQGLRVDGWRPHLHAEPGLGGGGAGPQRYFGNTSLAVNPNAEGDLWLADGNAVYHSVDSGATWTKLSQFASIMGSNPWPDVQGATLVALGKAAPGAAYSAAIYVVGVMNGVWGVYRSDDGGAPGRASTTTLTSSAASARWRPTRTSTDASTSAAPAAACCTQPNPCRSLPWAHLLPRHRVSSTR